MNFEILYKMGKLYDERLDESQTPDGVDTKLGNQHSAKKLSAISTQHSAIS